MYKLWNITISGSVINANGSSDPDQYQYETDPQHCPAIIYFVSRQTF